jgi:serine/threonine-protein kinase RsbT
VADFRRRIVSQADVEAARHAAGTHGRACHLSDHATAELALICSELAANLLAHARDGYLTVRSVTVQAGPAVRVEAEDSGPGIANLDLALTAGYTTTGTLGQGLPMAQRLANQFEIESSPQGTKVAATKWK